MLPGEDFDQTAFELTPAPLKSSEDPAQSELFADDLAQPDANDREPAFWAHHATDAFPQEDSVQPDTPETG